ncbi:S-adenosyl-L-methionine-dependent methyltransferase [Neurospora hispaniola]|uniref:S-adenosyl-L-methionine-dependent methyltransferase n=1 Tax=Neurospora hispaniola TaxID=588809 RepID=A0AAJ0MSN2_9PEZI|nr:S-adenosyl-L-methionine-dependent methyltransferase [Neurospora hispaniola]
MSTPAIRKAVSPTPGSSPPARPAPAGPTSPAAGSPEAAGVSSSAAPANTDDALTGAHWLQQGMPEEDAQDADSSLDSDVESSTASISSTIFNYRMINGRTYHSDAVTDIEYWAPNDEKHLDSLEIYYHDNIERVIDIGTGAGFWAIDFADKYPNCEVIGTDISPVQPSWVPPNLNFEISDASKEWTYKPNYFDLVHVRFFVGAIEDWNAFYREAFKVCKPGGWIEHYDHSPVVTSDDGSVVPGSAMDTYGKVLAEAARRIGRSATLADDDTMEEGLKAAGFVNIQTKRMKMPLSPWSDDKKLKEVGLCAYSTLSADVEGVVQYLFGNVMGWTPEEISVFAAHMCRELKDKNIHGYYHWKYVWAQKPEDAQ